MTAKKIKAANMKEPRISFPEKSFSAGEIIISQGVPSDQIFFIIEGSAWTQILNEDGEQIILGVRSTGDFMGEPFFLGIPEPAFFVARENCIVKIILKSAFPALLQLPYFLRHYCDFQNRRQTEIIAKMQRPLRHKNSQTEKRIRQELKSLSGLIGKKNGDNPPVSKIKISHEELAGLTNFTRETVTRCVTSLREAGVILGEKQCKSKKILVDLTKL